jgi:acyl carrier protein
VEREAKTTVKEFLAEQLLIEFTADVDEDSDLFQLGLMDSYSYIELIKFLEKEFSLNFTNEEVLSNVVVSIAGIVALVSEKKAASL